MQERKIDVLIPQCIKDFPLGVTDTSWYLLQVNYKLGERLANFCAFPLTLDITGCCLNNTKCCDDGVINEAARLILLLHVKFEVGYDNEEVGGEQIDAVLEPEM